MKPVSLCLVQMGDKGLELVKAHPNVLPKQVLNEITYKSMPMGAKPGEFSSATVGDLYYSSYVFSLPREDSRDNIAAIIAVFNNMKYNIEGIRKVFSFIIKELDTNKLLKTDIVEEIMPNLYKGFDSGHIKIKISSIATIDIDFAEKEEPEEKDCTNDLEDDLWR
ncbi:MAG: hypothetical protein GNW80_02645 [Asgard group archaeon]|nr:hypothetical protein [Asgard group archaeon]